MTFVVSLSFTSFFVELSESVVQMWYKTFAAKKNCSMATVCVKILKHHLKADGTFNIKIRITHNRVKRYIETEHFVTIKQLTKKLTLKDPILEQTLNTLLVNYRMEISNLGEKLQFMTADQIRDHLARKDEVINFIAFCDEHIRWLRKQNRNGTASNQVTVRNSLVDFFKRGNISVMEITSSMLNGYERYLTSERELTRVNQLQKEVTTVKKGLSPSGLYNHMRDLRTLFNAAREHYNDDEIGIIKIPHYPFKKYKIGTPPKTASRSLKNIDVRKLLTATTQTNSRAELAKELFTLSFMLCGINATDLYQCTKANIRNCRLEYNRSKTKKRRKDSAFISIKIPKEAESLLNKYIGHLHERYCNPNGLDTALSKGMKQLCTIAGLSNVTFYWARHSFASIARNECRLSKDDIALALNHVDNGHRVTDIYISKDWTIVDEVQAAVIATLYTKNKKPVQRRVRKMEAEIENNSNDHCVVRQLNPRAIKSN
jgi:integrase